MSVPVLTVLATSAAALPRANAFLANQCADVVLGEFAKAMPRSVAMQPFDFVVRRNGITNRDFEGTPNCTLHFEMRRLGDGTIGKQGMETVVGLNVGFPGTQVSCAGEVVGDTVSGRARKTSVECPLTARSYALVEVAQVVPELRDIVARRALPAG